MTRPEYSEELRERVLQAADAGLSAMEIARSFGISRRSLTRWRQWRRERGTVATRPRSGRPPKIAPGQYAALRAQIAAHPEATLQEHSIRWEQSHGTSISPLRLRQVLHRLGLFLSSAGEPPASMRTEVSQRAPRHIITNANLPKISNQHDG